MSVLVDLIVQVLPPVQARVRTHRLEPLARRLAALTDPREFAGEEQPALRLATLAALTVRLVRQLQVELAELERHIASHVEAYARAKTDEARRARLELMIEETAKDARSARADRQALSRHLDLDALRERFDLQREELVIAAELGIMIVGPALARALESEAIDASTSFVGDPSLGLHSEVRTILDQVEPVSFLLDQLDLVRRWPTRLACVESLERALEHLGVPMPISKRARAEPPSQDFNELRVALRKIGMDRSEHEWVQARALTCLRIVDGKGYRECVRERLGLDQSAQWVPDWPRRDFLTRGLIIDQLGSQLGNKADAELLDRAIEGGEASEFARIAHARVLGRVASHRPRSFARLARLLTRTPADAAESDQAEPGSGEGANAEVGVETERRQSTWQVQGPEGLELPRVHGTACLVMTQALATIGRNTQARKVAKLVIERLAATIAGISDPLVARIACEQAPIACRYIAANKGLRRDIERHSETLVHALHVCLADPSRSASIHEEASAAIEGIDCGARRDRSSWTADLADSIATIPSGQERTIRLPSHEGERPDFDELTRILPMLTRNDWGLDVDTRRGRLKVRRGDRKVLRMWRTLHEIRNPSGNKRQAYRHSVGRRYRGRLRAHPGRLDEVTQTVVPGERLHLDPEGGWGRHVPLVDDLIGLPWLLGGDRPVALASSHGVTRLRIRGTIFKRLRARWRLNFRYAKLAELRRRALLASEPVERRRFTDELRERYGVVMDFTPHPSPIGERPVPPRLGALFPKAAIVRAVDDDTDAEAETVAGSLPQASAAVAPVGLALPDVGEVTSELMREHLHYFLTLEGNSQEALGYYALGLSAYFLGSAYLRRRVIANARAAIPLSVGGWGTRGKSGTERLKAALFYGLGFRIFSKTTGCEAMFIHAPPLGPQVEIYTFRPYGKATIWEQRNLLCLAAGLDSEVFMWECMALNPEYVDILQRGWMRDDIATVTNTYPDHEDIQGPAGIDVATVIGRFVPERSVVLSSELGFNPVLRDAVAERNSEMVEINDYEGDLLADDLLALFPYSEHPRNIALVTELARQIGVDGDLAIVCMADYVYPDLGVLKFYPDVHVRGRTLSFVNGCSANERAGFLNNWRRTGCVDISAKADPSRMVITVVNNRDDRISRSEVFSRILVNDAAVDAHVLIGTNLAGLQIFLDRALEAFASEQELVDAEGLATGEEGADRARARLRALLLRVRAPVEEWSEHLETLIRLGLTALGRRYEEGSALARAVFDHVEGLRASEGSREFDTVVAKLASDQALSQASRALYDASPEDSSLLDPHEVGHGAQFDEWVAHLRDRIARMIIAARFANALEPILQARDSSAMVNLTSDLASAWTSLFRAQLVLVWDASATGDQIIDQCAGAVPPGVHVTVMGTQNIKGTGLDFIYRWQALDAVCLGLEKLDSEDENTRLEALRALDAHSDFGFTDTGILVKRLPEYTKGNAQEASLRTALLDKAKKIHSEKLGKLDGGATGAAAKGGRFWTWIEGWIDFMDGAVRYRQSQQLVQDLTNYRVSHNKMAVEMREIYARAKGGWLGKALKAMLKEKLGIGRSRAAVNEEAQEAPVLAEAEVVAEAEVAVAVASESAAVPEPESTVEPAPDPEPTD